MQPKEIVLESLIGSEIKSIQNKHDFWGTPITIPEGVGYNSQNCLTIEKFIEGHPLPKQGEDIALYGIAWEFVWGKPVPEEIEQAKETLRIKARTGMAITKTEELWLKIMTVDTDCF